MRTAWRSSAPSVRNPICQSSCFKDATVKRYFYETHEQLRMHLRDFVDAYNFARRLKTLRGLTPYEFICKAWTSDPQKFKISPLQQTPGLNISRRLRAL